MEVLRYRTGELKAAAARAREIEADERRLTRACEASEIVAELNEVEARAAALRAVLAREIEDAEGLRRDYEAAAMRLRGHLEGLVEAASSSAERAAGEAGASATRREKEEQREMREPAFRTGFRIQARLGAAPGSE